MSDTLQRFANGVRVFFGFPAKVYLDTPEDTGPLTHFMDVHHRMQIYLRALWDEDFILKQTNLATAYDEDKQPYIDDLQIYLPNYLQDLFGDAGRISGLDRYRAAVAHVSAHLIYTRDEFSPRSLDKWQMAMIALIEDARIEALAIRQYPGLKRLWASLHEATPDDDRTAGDYMGRLARALLDETYEDDDPWVAEGRRLFNAAENLQDSRTSRKIGVALADSFQQKKIKYHYGVDMARVPYRDDNRSMWLGYRRPVEIINPYLKSKIVRRIDEEAKNPDRIRKNTKEADHDTGELKTFHYPEWNYRNQRSDPSWVTVRETPAEAGDPRAIERIIEENRHLVTRMKNLLNAIRDNAVHRNRKLEVGDEIDINAAIRAQMDLRLGIQPDTRVMMRTERNPRDISVLVLLDLSRSMNHMVPGQEHSGLELIQQSSVLFAEAIDAVGDPFAIHGFCSENRHNVAYFKIKDFGDYYDDESKSKMAAMTGQLGTRMGAAIRHATHYLNSRKSSKKLLLLLSDGEPSDIDMPDKHYLRDDARKSVDEARHDGIHTYCFSLDPGADRYVSRIFGPRNYMVVDHIRSLPEKILTVYAGLSR